MAKVTKSFERFIGGISDYPTESSPGDADSYAFGRSVDTRTDPNNLTILPRTIKESGTVITDLPKWGETYPTTLDTYIYGDTGNIYKRTSSRSTTFLRMVANSHGNGMSYFGEDDFLYYTGDKVIGRYGPLSSTNPQFVDDFFGSQGGVPLNTNSLDLESGSSQYADRADTASLSITGNISFDLQIKPESLPTTGNSMTLVSKYNANGNQRSYKFDIAASSAYFGNGSDGSLTISTDTTEAPIDSACSGTVGTMVLFAINTSFAAGQVILVHKSRGTNAGTWQRTTISSYTAGTIIIVDPLNATYTSSGADCSQVRVVNQYTNVTVDAGKVYSPKPWNGTVGGILAFLANGTVTVNGTIRGGSSVAPGGGYSSSPTGYRGNSSLLAGSNATGYQGEGTASDKGTQSTSANGSGGGGGAAGSGHGGGGGGNGTAGSSASGVGGSTAGTADLTTMVFGGGGGNGGSTPADDGGPGGAGGGIIFISGVTVDCSSGSITSYGSDGQVGGVNGGGGGGGAGGSILIKAQVATLGTNKLLASGGVGAPNFAGTGGDGGTGRIHLDYYTSYTGTTTPTIDSVQDNNLANNTGYQLRLILSSNGTNSETYSQTFVPIIGTWQEVGVSWQASTSTAIFYFNAVALGTRTGAFTSIFDSTARFAIGVDFNSSGTAVNFYDGLIDEVRLFSVVRSANDYFNGLQQQILTTSSGFPGYWKLNGDYADATGNSNTLAGVNTPVFSTDVPYPSPTTRLDIDQSATTAGNTYTTPTTISEGATTRKTFTPQKDPQKSIAVLVAAIGTGNWTITVHDQYNNVITTATVTNTNMATGYYEFIFSTPWRPLINANYHFHLTSTVADGTVTTTNSADLETVSFRTYYQFLVTETKWHPVAKMLQFLVFGNERYVATYGATLYDANAIALAANDHVRCFGKWGEYLAIGVMKGTSITDFDQGRVYFWDGIAPVYNFFIDVPEGGINALYGVKDTLYIWAGYQGDLLEYKGGATAQKVKRMPLIEPTKYMEVYPGGVCYWKALLRFGGAGNTNSTSINQGGYTYGSITRRYSDSLTYDYPISTGTLTGTNLKIGLVMAVGSELLIGWQDNVSYGLDYVNSNNAPYPTATTEFIITDDATGWKQKEANVVVAVVSPLNSGESFLVKSKLNEATDWTLNPDGETTTTSDDSTVNRMILTSSRYYRFQVACDLFASGSTAPTLQAMAVETDNKEGEKRV